MKHKWLLCSLCFTALNFQGLLADDANDEGEACGNSAKPMRISLRHIESGGVGYNQGYTTLEGFFAPDTNKWSYMPFLDLRGHVFDNGRFAANAGIGVRTMWGDRAYGANVYYDYRDTRRFHYNQVSFGLETLGTFWDVRANGYFPVGKTKSRPDDPKFYKFSGHNLVISRKYEFAMTGADAEIGFHFAKHNDYDWYTAAGPYYFKGDIGDAAWGGKVRLSAEYKKYFVIELSESYDNVFKNHFQAQVTFSYPFGPKSPVKKKTGSSNSCNFYETMSDRMVQPVGRDEIIVLDTHRKKSTAIDPATGLPFVFWFVDNRSHSLGTFESPFNALVDAQNASGPNNIIYVYPGDGTVTNMDAGIVLQNGQRLLGSSNAHYVQTSHGRITIPQMSTRLPVIGNTGGAVVTVVDRNEVSGFYIQNLAGNGISQPNAGITISNLVITNNIIQGNGAFNGVNVNNVAGMLLYNNDIAIQNSSIVLNSVNVNNATYSIVNNTFELANTGCLVIDLTDSSNVSTVIAGNSFSTSAINISLNLSNTTFAAPHSFSIYDNLMNCENVPLAITMINDSSASFSISNNEMFTGHDNAIDFALSQNAIANLTITGNILDAWDHGLFISASNQSQVTALIENNAFISQVDIDLFVETGGSSVVSASILNNSFTTFSGENIFLSLGSTSLNSFDISGNTMLGSGGDGITLNALAGPVIVNVEKNNISSVPGIGLLVNNTGTGSLQSIVENNQFTACVNGAVQFIQNNAASSTCLRFLNNTATPIQTSAGNDTYQFGQVQGTFNLEPLSGNTGIVRDPGVTNVPAGTCD